MKAEIKIDENCKEPKIIVVTDKMTDEITDLVKKLSDGSTDQPFIGFRGESVKVLEPSCICRFYASAGKVFAQTDDGDYLVRLRLYEAEQRLDNRTFIRISYSEIVNIKKVKSFDLSFTGTIRVTLSEGTVTYVSRRYVSKIKKVLGL